MSAYDDHRRDEEWNARQDRAEAARLPVEGETEEAFDEGALRIVLDQHNIGRLDISLNARVCVLQAVLTRQAAFQPAETRCCAECGVKSSALYCRQCAWPKPPAETRWQEKHPDTESALQYAIALCEGRLDVEAPYHVAIIKRYIAALKQVQQVVAPPTEKGADA